MSLLLICDGLALFFKQILIFKNRLDKGEANFVYLVRTFFQMIILPTLFLIEGEGLFTL